MGETVCGLEERDDLRMALDALAPDLVGHVGSRLAQDFLDAPKLGLRLCFWVRWHHCASKIRLSLSRPSTTWRERRKRPITPRQAGGFVVCDYSSAKPVISTLAVFRLKGQPKRQSKIIVGSCKASQSPVYPIGDAFAVVDHPTCLSSSSSFPLPVG